MKAYNKFKEKYYLPIMELIEAQRIAFPETGLHGYAHIARCLVLTHVLCKMHEIDEENELKCLIAIGLHDVAREDDGEDLWEEQSGIIAKEFCAKHGLSPEFQDEVYKLITEKTDVNDLPNKNFIVCHDADCLDIIRCFGIDRFDIKHLASFPDKRGLRDFLIDDACTLIDVTFLDGYDYDNKKSLLLMEKNIKTVWNWKFYLINTLIN
ncbi:MAG: hypothetical protein IPJ01_11090 [Micavibrio sp.]|nr:hypothetical protein [Micavibrio sp.]